MLSTTFVVAGLSTGQKIGLATVGGLFIAFALISSFVLPRRNPNFPGRHVGLFVTVGVLFFVAMISAVLIFGREKPEAEAGTGGETTTAQTTTAAPPTTTAGGAGSGGGGSAQGDATAGKAVFASAGCGGCHTLKAAGSSGNVGPNLDDLKPDFATVQHQVENGGGAMPAFKGMLTQKQIDDVSAYVASSAGGS
jgi:mono/diheme cytochrome c family protein